MDYTVMMRFSQRFGDLFDDLDSAPDGQLLSQDEIAERLAFDQLHHNIRFAVVRLAVVVNGSNVWVRQRRNGARFAQKSRSKLGVMPSPRMKSLDCYTPPEHRVLSQVHHAHSAFAELFEDSIMRNRLSD
jgi:hypothetical protein